MFVSRLVQAVFGLSGTPLILPSITYTGIQKAEFQERGRNPDGRKEGTRGGRLGGSNWRVLRPSGSSADVPSRLLGLNPSFGSD